MMDATPHVVTAYGLNPSSAARTPPGTLPKFIARRTKVVYKLSPDDNGSYVNGNWSRLDDWHVGRRYFASGMLADGRLVVCGGEYSDASGSVQNDDSNTCEIYDPTTNAWSTFAAPMTSGNRPVTQFPPGSHLGDGVALCDCRVVQSATSVPETRPVLSPKLSCNGSTAKYTIFRPYLNWGKSYR